jgi:drug/metabolite transporter (DMT)-like permease
MDLSTALALVASAFLGTAVVLANVGLRYLDPARGALVAIPSTALMFWVLAAFLFRGEGWNATAFAIFATVGLIFPALVTFLNFASNRLVGPTVAGTLSGTTPLFAVLGALLFLGEPLTLLVAAGTIAIVIGVVTLASRDSDRPRHISTWVLLIPLAGAAIRGGAQAAVKGGLTLWPDPFAAVLIGYSVSSVMILAGNRALVQRAGAILDRRGIFWFAVVGICNGLGVLAMYAALARGQVSVVSPLAATYPLVTLALSALFLREEKFRVRVLLGVAITVVGAVILARA